MVLAPTPNLWKGWGTLCCAVPHDLELLCARTRVCICKSSTWHS